MRSNASAGALAPQNTLLRIALGLVRRMRWLVERFGIDHPRFMTLLAVYAMLDERRGKQRYDEPPASPFSGGLVLTCLFNLVIGLFGGIMLLADDVVLGMGSNQTLVLMFAVMLLVADYSSVLLDDTDIALVSPLPVPDRTFFAARVAHVVLYLSLVLGSLALPGLVLGCVRHPPLVFLPTYLACTVLTTMLALGIGSGTFVLAMRIFDVDRFQDILLYAQIAVIVIFMGGMQLLPHVVDMARLEGFLDHHGWVAFLVPSFHQGGLLALVEGDASGRNVVLASLAVLLPVGMFLILLRLASRGFLAGLGGGSSRNTGGGVVAAPKSWFRDRLLGDPVARAGFDFFRALSRRERGYRLRTYPVVVVSLVIAAVTAFGGRASHPVLLCSAIYLVGLCVPAFLIQSRFSANWQARWLLAAAPVPQPGRFISGAMLALGWTWFLPLFLVLSGVVWAAGGMAVLPDAAFAALAMLTVAGQTTRIIGTRVPFTERASRSAAEGNLGLMIMLSFVVGMCVGLHAVLRSWLPAYLTAIAVLVVVAYATLRSLGRIQLGRGGWVRRA